MSDAEEVSSEVKFSAAVSVGVMLRGKAAEYVKMAEFMRMCGRRDLEEGYVMQVAICLRLADRMFGKEVEEDGKGE